MKVSVVTFFVVLFLQQLCPAQPVQQTVPLDIMTTAVSRSSMDSVPLKVSVPDDIHLSELTFPISNEESGKIFITGTPYDSIQVQVPTDISVSNQHGEKAVLQEFQLMYGSYEDLSAMEVISPAGCVTLQIPETGRIDMMLGGTLFSEYNLKGIYTGTFSFECNCE